MWDKKRKQQQLTLHCISMGTSGCASLWDVRWSHNWIECTLLFHSLNHVWWECEHSRICTWRYTIRCWWQWWGLRHNWNKQQSQFQDGQQTMQLSYSMTCKRESTFYYFAIFCVISSTTRTIECMASMKPNILICCNSPSLKFAYIYYLQWSQICVVGQKSCMHCLILHVAPFRKPGEEGTAMLWRVIDGRFPVNPLTLFGALDMEIAAVRVTGTSVFGWDTTCPSFVRELACG